MDPAPPPEKRKIDNMSPNWGIMLTIQENLNTRIGVRRRKKYLSAAFWNYISTPINFVITLFTAISASQTGTTNTYLSSNQVFYILLTTFVLSIINTFFKLKEKAQLNYDAAKMYEEFGTEFENIYFTPILKEGDVELKLKKYNELYTKMMTYSNNENIDGVNYITECIYFLTKKYLNDRKRQIEKNERYWVLDGRPNVEYVNDFEIEMENFFIDDFNKKPDPPICKHEPTLYNLYGFLGHTNDNIQINVKQESEGSSKNESTTDPIACQA
jgi:hypothetical protein